MFLKQITTFFLQSLQGILSIPIHYLQLESKSIIFVIIDAIVHWALGKNDL
jgi:hypothetical protein